MKKTAGLLFLVCLLLHGIAQSGASKIDSLLRDYKFTGTVLVAQKGKVIFQKGYGVRNVETGAMNDINTIYPLGGITQTFAAALVLRLVEENQISLHNKLSLFYKGFPHGGDITIEDLLMHTSGIADFLSNPVFLQHGATLPQSDKAILSLFVDKPLVFVPGYGYLPSNSNYWLLGHIIERVTESSFEDVLRAEILGPLGMDHCGFDFLHLEDTNKARGYTDGRMAPLLDGSVLFSSAGMYGTVGDLFLWHEALLHRKVIGYWPHQYGWKLDTVDGREVKSCSGKLPGFCGKLAWVLNEDISVVLLSNNEDDALVDLMCQKICSFSY